MFVLCFYTLGYSSGAGLAGHYTFVDSCQKIIDFILETKIFLFRLGGKFDINIGWLKCIERTDSNSKHIISNMINKHQTILREYFHHKRIQQAHSSRSITNNSIHRNRQIWFHIMLNELLLCQFLLEQLVWQFILIIELTEQFL